MNDVDKYISNFLGDTKTRLNEVRKIILDSSPEIVENMAYGMPGYKLNGKPLIYFGAFKTHIGLYATPSGHKKFEMEFSKYKQGKGSVQFPLTEPLPRELIKKVVTFRIKECNEKQ